MIVRKVAATLVGLLVATYELYWATIFGPGGWHPPLYCSILMLVAYPIVLVRLVDTDGESIRIDLMLLAMAAIGDAYLFGATLLDDDQYDHFTYIMNLLPQARLWLFLWFAWQLLSMLGVSIRLGRRIRKRGSSWGD